MNKYCFIGCNIYINVLIFLILLLIFSQLYIYLFPNIENMENDDDKFKEYEEDALILAKQNAGNIKVLKDSVDNVNDIKGQVDTMQTDLDNVNKQMEDLLIQQQELAAEVAGGDEPHDISGV
jgi:hypothetical protein